ncbi:MAG: 5'-deoxynucleotidase, partial [Clostridia bacterium]
MKNKRNHFFAYLSRMKYINRWGLMRNSLPENIQEHSLQVAIIAHALAVIKNTYFNGKVDVNKAAVMGIFHDSNEIITGDLPTPIKYYNPEINIAYKQIENISKERLIG